MADMQRNQVNGILLVDKDPDWTSHDVVNVVRKQFFLSKVGHCGTLDPFASGLLVLLLGKATKLQEQFMNQDKRYSGVIYLGVETDSQDRTGLVTATRELGELSEDRLLQAAQALVGKQEQIPPMHSAVKLNGIPLYKLARQGKTVERKARSIIIHAFELLGHRWPELDFTVKCSKGTYIRTLAVDFGKSLGCGAHLRELRRLQSGSFQVENACRVDIIRSWNLAELQKHIIPIENAN